MHLDTSTVDRCLAPGAQCMHHHIISFIFWQSTAPSLPSVPGTGAITLCAISAASVTSFQELPVDIHIADALSRHADTISVVGCKCTPLFIVDSSFTSSVQLPSPHPRCGAGHNGRRPPLVCRNWSQPRFRSLDHHSSYHAMHMALGLDAASSYNYLV